MKKKHKGITNRQIKLIICGYYGRGSLGDELILEAILRAVRSLSAKKCGAGKGFILHIKVLSSKNPIKIFLTLARSDLFIFGGGSLLQNLTSDASLLYYLAVIRAASVLSHKNIMLSNGIGPIKKESPLGIIGAQLLPSALAGFDAISVRDCASRAYIENLLSEKEIALIPDPVLTLSDIKIDKSRPNPVHTEPYFVYVPCTSGLSRAEVSEEALAESLQSLSNHFGKKIKIAIFNKREDPKSAERLARCGGEFSVHLARSREDAIRLLEGSELVISQRYHATLLALTAQKPVLSASDDPKMTALCDELGAFSAVPTRTLANSDTLRALTEQVIETHSKSKESIAERLRCAEQKARTGLFTILDKYIFESGD